MKRAAIAFVILALLLCIGCGLWSDPADESLIVVHSGGADVAPYENFRWSKGWSNGGWVSADSFYLIGELEELSKAFPTITYSDDFEIHCQNNVSVTSVNIYDSSLNDIHWNMPPSVIETLSPGTYYLIITVKQQGYYVPAGKDYEYTGYDCGYKLIIE